MYEQTVVGNVDSCRLETEISDSEGNVIGIVFEDEMGWHVEPTAATNSAIPNPVLESVKANMSRYVNRTGQGAPDGTTRGEQSLWLMLKDDGTAMGLPYYV
jgi:hypothetical protein